MKVRAAGYSLAALGAVLLIYGATIGGYMPVLRKAVTICLECIGIG